MFTVEKNPTFTHEVPIHVPVDGGTETQTIKATYTVMTDEESETFNTGHLNGMKEFLIAAKIKMADLQDPEGKALPYNDKVRDQLLALPYVCHGLFNGYLKGISNGRLGN